MMTTAIDALIGYAENSDGFSSWADEAQVEYDALKKRAESAETALAAMTAERDTARQSRKRIVRLANTYMLASQHHSKLINHLVDEDEKLSGQFAAMTTERDALTAQLKEARAMAGIDDGYSVAEWIASALKDVHKMAAQLKAAHDFSEARTSVIVAARIVNKQSGDAGIPMSKDMENALVNLDYEIAALEKIEIIHET
jgi:chaperonin cofactor prefoldin